MVRKREEGQRKRGAVPQISVASAASTGKTQQEKLPLVNVLQDLTLTHSSEEIKKLCKAQHKKNKEEPHKGKSLNP